MLSQIALSNDTVKRRMDELSQDIKDQLFDQIKQSPFFAIHCNEMTDIESCSKLLLYPRFLSVNTIRSAFLPSKKRLCNISQNFKFGKLFSGKQIVMGIIPDITGLKSGFIKREKEKKFFCNKYALHTSL